MPAGTRVERDMILHAVGQEAAKKPMPLRAAKGKGKKQMGAKQRKGVSKQRAAAEPKRSQGRPTNAERQRRAAATTGYRNRLMRRQVRLLLGLLPVHVPYG